ncbi:MAG: P-type conjugative transfer protein TrbJ [Methyloligellaceae bacterium]
MSRSESAKLVFFIILSLSIFLAQKRAGALTVFDPVNYAQNLLTAANTLKSLEHQIQQLTNQAQMLLNMEKNLKGLGSSISEPLQHKLSELRHVVDRAGNLALRIEQVEGTYRRLYPHQYRQALTMDQVVKTAKERWDHRLQTFHLSLGVQAQILDNVKEDQGHLVDLMLKSRQAEGARSAIQAGNEMMALNVKQLLQLQTLLALQARATVLDQAERASSQKEAQEYFRTFMGRWGDKQ